MTADGRAAFIKGLRQLADKLEQEPSIPLPWTGTGAGINFIFVNDGERDRPAMDAAAQALGAKWRPDDVYGDDRRLYLRREGHLAGLMIGLLRLATPEDGPAEGGQS